MLPAFTSHEPRATNHVRLFAAALAVAVVALLLLMPLPFAWHGRWQSRLLDLGHVPLFAALTLWLWLVLRGRLLVPVVVSLVVAGLAEIIQPLFGRTGDLLDFVRGALGTFAAAALVRAWQGPRTIGRVAAYVLAALALVAWPLADEGPYLLDAWRGYRAFPTLADFGTAGELLRWDCHQAVLERRPDPDRPGGWLGRLDLLPGDNPYPGATLEPILADWTGYRQVCCSFRVDGNALRLVFGVRTASSELGRTTHYQFEKVYAPGEHQACIDLGRAAGNARPLPLDLARVRYFHVFAYSHDCPATVRLQRVWLE
jgi:hypothetical protein